MAVMEVARTEEEVRAMLMEMVEEGKKAGITTGDALICNEVAAGTATIEDIRNWVTQHYLSSSRRSTQIVAAWLLQAPDDMADIIVENIIEEGAGIVSKTEAHPKLLVRFMKAIGLDMDKVNQMPLSVEAQALQGYTWHTLLNKPWYHAIGLGLSLEVGLPTAYVKLYNGLKQHYGLSERDLEFFSVHLEVDEDHAEGLMRILAKHIGGDYQAQKAIRETYYYYNVLKRRVWDSYKGYSIPEFFTR